MRDLLELVRQDVVSERVASTNGGEYAGPCPFCGGTDRFRCWPDHPDGGGGHWWCRQCNRGGDLIAYLVERGDITPQEAGRLRHQDYSHPNSRMVRRQPTRAPVRGSAKGPPVAWQRQGRTFCRYCQQSLLGGDNEGLRHLHQRGLNDDTIRTWGLGWHDEARRCDPADWGLEGKKVYLPRGIVIPWTVDQSVYHVKVRLFETWKGKTPKYIRVRGGTPTLYGLDHIKGNSAAVMCEGELDAVLLDQEAGDLVDVVAIGSKSAKVASKGLVHLLGASRWLLALDIDAEEEAEVWSQYSRRVHRVRPLGGNDLTEFHQAGGDLRAWIAHVLDELGITLGGQLDAQSSALEPKPASIWQQAELLLAQANAGPTWARAWAELAATVGWPCYGTSWSQWAEGVAREGGKE